MEANLVLVALHAQLQPKQEPNRNKTKRSVLQARHVIRITIFFTASLSTLHTRKRELCWLAGGSCALA
jgi:hypothetical protein